MRCLRIIGLFCIVVFVAACDSTTREARVLVKRAELLADTLPDSTALLIDSVLRMPASFSERERMDMALLQAEALFGCRDVACNVSDDICTDTLGDVSRDVSTISPIMDDNFFDDHATLSTSPELERAAAYYAKKKLYAKAAHTALYSGFVQQHYNEKEAAMRSFKEAEEYGRLAVDSLTVAQAEYRMGKMLFDEGLKEEALTMLQAANLGFNEYFSEKALVLNMIGVCYILLKQYDNAEFNLKESLNNAKKGDSFKAKRNALNNMAVLCRLQKKQTDAIKYLRQTIDSSNTNETEWFVYYLNMAKTYTFAKEMDSTLFYFKMVENLLFNEGIKLETRVSAYGALSQFAEQQGDIQKALQYKDWREDLLSKVLVQRQEQAVFRIQKQYDYESLQNVMNKKLIQRQHVITFFGIVTIIGLAALAISQIRLAKTRKQEAKTKANLFHFMQQNKELTLRSK